MSDPVVLLTEGIGRKNGRSLQLIALFVHEANMERNNDKKVEE